VQHISRTKKLKIYKYNLQEFCKYDLLQGKNNFAEESKILVDIHCKKYFVFVLKMVLVKIFVLNS